MIGSLPSRGAWIEISTRWTWVVPWASLPSRGAWIEIEEVHVAETVGGSLPSRGAWIEILEEKTSKPWALRRSPHGERGLK